MLLQLLLPLSLYCQLPLLLSIRVIAIASGTPPLNRAASSAGSVMLPFTMICATVLPVLLPEAMSSLMADSAGD